MHGAEDMDLKKVPSYVGKIALTLLLLLVGFGLCLVFQNVLEARSLVPMGMVFTVFLVSLLVRGYPYGLIASLASILAVNYVFDFPYQQFDFTIPENLTTAAVMLLITTLTSTLTNKIRYQEKVQNERDLEKMRANLLRAVSHDIRTPLTTIYGASSAIAESGNQMTREQVVELAGDIQQDADWLIRMVENLLSITRFDSGGVTLSKTPTVLEELVDSVLVKFQKRYPNQKVQVEIPDEFVSIPMDAVLISQVLVNLLENAVLHADNMQNLWLKVDVDKKWATFHVIDDGGGLPKELLGDNIVAYRSQQQNPSGDGKKRNMGIGLSVCASIIRAHGGRLLAENRPGGGAMFSFRLEREEPDDGQ